MKTLAILFWAGALLVFYTYLGYGLLLRGLVSLRERFRPRKTAPQSDTLPETTLLIAAYNEEAVVAEKMANCLAQDYPAEKLHIVWVTDGSTDRTDEKLSAYEGVRVLHEGSRRGKTAALNRAMEHIATPLVICTDANTMLNTGAVSAIVRNFADPAVGCVAGEKRVANKGGGKCCGHGRRILALRVETQGVGRPSLHRRGSRRRAVRLPTFALRAAARGYVARRFHDLDADRRTRLPHRLLQGGLCPGIPIGRHG